MFGQSVRTPTGVPVKSHRVALGPLALAQVSRQSNGFLQTFLVLGCGMHTIPPFACIYHTNTKFIHFASSFLVHLRMGLASSKDVSWGSEQAQFSHLDYLGINDRELGGALPLYGHLLQDGMTRLTTVITNNRFLQSSLSSFHCQRECSKSNGLSRSFNSVKP